MNILNDPTFDTVADEHERRTGLPKGILRAVISRESGGRNIPAANGDGGMGVMQFTDPGVIKHYNVNPSDPWDSLRAGADYLGDGLKKYGKIEAALADFHRGPKAAARVLAGQPIGEGPIEKTYIEDVLARAGMKPSEVKRTLAGSAVVAAAAEATKGIAPVEPEKVTAGQDVMNALASSKDSAGLGDVFRAARLDPNIMLTYQIADAVVADTEEPVVPGWWESVRDKETEGFSEAEVLRLERNVRGPQSLMREKAAILAQREADKVYGDAGFFTSLLGTAGASMTDPATMAAGFGVGGLFRIAKIGSGAMVAAGRPGMAAASAVGESVAGEVGLMAAVDIANGNQTAADYAAAVIGGAAFGAIPARGAYKQAAERAAFDLMQTHAADIESTRPLTTEQRIQTRADEAKVLNEVVTNRPVTETPMVPKSVADEVAASLDADATPLPKPKEEPKIVSAANGPAAAVLDFPSIDEEFETAPSSREVLDRTILDLHTKHKSGDFTGTTSTLLKMMRNEDIEDILTGEDEELINQLLAEADRGTALHPREYPERPFGTLDGRPVTLKSQDSADIPRAVEDARTSGDGTEIETTARGLLEAYRDATPKSMETQALGHSKLAAWLLDRLEGDPALDSIKVFVKKHMPGAKALGERGASNALGVAKFAATRAISAPNGEIPGGLTGLLSNVNQWAWDTGLHELIHNLTVPMLDLWRTSPASLDPTVRAAINRLEDVRVRLAEVAKAKGIKETDGTGVGYAIQNLQEFVAMALSDKSTQIELARMPASPSFGGRFGDALREVMHTIISAIGFKQSKRQGKLYAMDEVLWAFEAMIDRRSGGMLTRDGTQFPGWPGNLKMKHRSFTNETMAYRDNLKVDAAQAPVNPLAAIGSAKRWARTMYDHATQFVAANPIDVSRLKPLSGHLKSLSDGLVLAGSKNPIAQMAASLMVETTTGAAGRRPTAALRKYLLQRQLTGNMLVDYDAAYQQWARANGLGRVSEALTQQGRKQFDRAVYLEILERRTTGQPVSTTPQIRRAADALEAAATRSLEAQKNAGVLGNSRLPENSVGYIPQALSGKRLAVATPEELEQLTDHLANHFATVNAWDARFSREFSRYYIRRAQARALNTKGVDVMGGENAATVVRDTLEAMRQHAGDPASLDAILQAEAAFSKAGQGQTKRRLDVGLTTVLPNGLRVLDFYEDNPIMLMRQHVDRVSGNVALTEFGVHGATGVRHLRDALTSPEVAEQPRATQQEIDAFDRVMAELLGGPMEGEIRSLSARNIGATVRLARLGGMVFTQAAESVQIAYTLGLGPMLKSMAALPRIMGEVGRLKRGQASGNHILTSIEKMGTEFGMDSYKLTFPFEAPDERLAEYAAESGLGTRALNALEHGQAKFTGFRAILAAQHRIVAEQIVRKAMRYVREGKSDKYLADMGLDADLIAHLRVNLPRIARFDASGDLIDLDISALPNPVAASQFVQMVHRGVGQMIQHTFIGERTAWMHNDYAKLLLQLRTFGFTAMEKQWSRVAQVNGGGAAGYGTAAMLLVAQMALIAPIYLARVHASSLGREDREEYVSKQLEPVNLVRNLMNYSSLAGLTGDFLEVAQAVSGAWLGDESPIGARTGQPLTASSVIPALGLADQSLKVLQGGYGQNNAYQAMKLLPGANIPYVVPFINLLKE